MGKISPFRGFYYNAKKVSELNRVISPPYDVISQEKQKSLISNSKYSYVNIIKNADKGNPYANASSLLKEWIKEKVILQDTERSIYLLSQTFRHDNEVFTRNAFIANIELEEFGLNILPHEETFEKHIEDRYQLLDATRCNSGLIYTCYKDPDMTVESMINNLNKTPPLLRFDIDGMSYQIWGTSNPDQINKMSNLMKNKKILIADGHHRYKTSLKYYKDNPTIKGANLIMASFVNTYCPGMVVLPTYRLLKSSTVPFNVLIDKLKRNFIISKVNSVDDLIQNVNQQNNQNSSSLRIGIHQRQLNQSYLLNFQFDDNQNKPLTDINVLNKHIFNDIFSLKINTNNYFDQISFLKGDSDSVNHLNENSNHDIAFIVKSPDIDDVFSFAQAGKLMPQKSTYFFPKIYSGIIIRKF